MRYLAAATVLACALGAFNLVLVMGVIRRLRAMTTAHPDGPTAGGVRVTLRPGEAPAEFTATTVDGERVTREGMAGNLIGFFSPDCPACTERLPEFVSYAEAIGGRQRALAVLIGEPGELIGLRRALDGTARTVIEPVFGEVATAFSVIGYLAVCLLGEDGLVRHAGTDLRTFPARPKALV